MFDRVAKWKVLWDAYMEFEVINSVLTEIFVVDSQIPLNKFSYWYSWTIYGSRRSTVLVIICFKQKASLLALFCVMVFKRFSLHRENGKWSEGKKRSLEILPKHRDLYMLNL